MPLSFRVKYLHHLFVFMHETLSLSPLFIDLFNCFSVSGWIYGHLFYTLSYNPMPLILLFKLSSVGLGDLFYLSPVSL